jgi:hypothetical protein
MTVDELMAACPLVEAGPEAFLPDWALDFYRSLRDQLRDNSAGFAAGRQSASPVHYA